MKNKNGDMSTLEFIAWAVLYAFVLWFIDTQVQDFLRPVEVKQVDTSELSPMPLTKTLKKLECQADTECQVLAEAIVFEARNQPIAGQVAVGYVILNRQKQERYPDTIEGVVNFKCHFSYTCWQQKTSPALKDWHRAYVVAYNVMHGLVANPIKEADHYHTKAVSPYWAKHMTFIASVGDHKFYKDKGIN